MHDNKKLDSKSFPALTLTARRVTDLRGDVMCVEGGGCCGS